MRRSMVFGFAFLFSVAVAPAMGAVCGNDADYAAAGFQCTPTCPASPGAGLKYEQFDCKCDKDNTAGTCTPAGVCKEYTTAGRPTGNQAACLCDKSSTAPMPEAIGLE